MTDEVIDTAPAAPEPIAEAPAEAPQEPQATDAPENTAEATTDAPVSRQDAIKKAFDAVEAQENPKQPEKTQDADEGQPRGPDGKFAKKDETPEQPKAEDSPTDAPSRFSPDAKAEWAKAPKSVQAEINRAIGELEKGIQEKDAAIAPLKPFMEMAQKSGTTIEAALTAYTNMENLLLSDPKAGLERLASNMGMTLPDLVAKATGEASTSTDKDRQIVQLQQEIQGLKGQVTQVGQSVQEQQTSANLAYVQQFANDNPRFDELAGEIAEMLQTGYAKDLADAYSKADRLNPLPVTPTPAPAQTRTPQSVTGAPSAGSNPAIRKPSGNRQDAISSAFARAGLS